MVAREASRKSHRNVHGEDLRRQGAYWLTALSTSNAGIVLGVVTSKALENRSAL
jgi:hypothetical protein